MSHMSASASVTEPCNIYTLSNSSFVCLLLLLLFLRTNKYEKEIKLTGIMEMVPKGSVYDQDKCASSVSFFYAIFCNMTNMFTAYSYMVVPKEVSFAC